MDISIDISQNGVHTLTTAAKDLELAVNEIDRSLYQLIKAAQTYSDDLGIYAEEVFEFITEQEKQIKKSEDSMFILVKKMNTLAAWMLMKISEYQKAESVGVLSAANEATKLDSQRFNVAYVRQKNGAVFIKGAHYEEFIKGYYDYENTTHRIYETMVTRTVAASMIEGLRLSPDEVEHSEYFWGENKKEFYLEIASHIPEVRDALARGRELSDLIEDPGLGRCASLYFDPRNMPVVEKWDDYYFFNGSGRHRILAAMELGYDIPVRITGERRYNRK